MAPQKAVIWNLIGAWVATTISRLMACYAIIQGSAIILFSPHRWSAQAYHTAMLLPGAPDSWGIVLLTAGVIALTGSVTKRMMFAGVGHFLAAAWSLFFAMTLLKEAIYTPTAGITGIFTYGAIAMVYIVLAVSAKQLSE